MIHRELWFRLSALSDEKDRLHHLMERGLISPEEFAQKIHQLWRRERGEGSAQEGFLRRVDMGLDPPAFQMTPEWVFAHQDAVHQLLGFQRSDLGYPALSRHNQEAYKETPEAVFVRLSVEQRAILDAAQSILSMVGGAVGSADNPRLLLLPHSWERVSSEAQWDEYVYGIVKRAEAFKKEVKDLGLSRDSNDSH